VTPFLEALGVEAVLFDAGGVLVLPDPTVLGPLLAYYGGGTEAHLHVRAHYAGMAAKARAGAVETEWSDYDHAYVEVVGVEPDARGVAARVLGRTRHAHLWRWPIAAARQGLQALSERGVPIGVVSNASGQIAETLARSGICQVGPGEHVPVRCIVDSHVVGVEKPDPRIFDHAVPELAGIPRARIAYVGDSPHIDVAGARAAGLVPVLVDPYDDHDGPELDGVARVHSVADLVD
jgi:putative hydrolase of the HAD superfamily